MTLEVIHPINKLNVVSLNCKYADSCMFLFVLHLWLRLILIGCVLIKSGEKDNGLCA